MVRHPKRKGRGIALSTVIMLGVTAVVLLGSVGMLLKLRNSSVSLGVSDLTQALTADWSLTQNPDYTGAPSPTAAPQDNGNIAAGLVLMPVATATPTTAPEAHSDTAQTIRLTFGGTFSLQSDVRQSCYYAATKSYDFSELFSLIGGRLEGDLVSLTLENLTSGTKYSDVLAPASLMSGLKSNGIGLVALGFPKCLEKNATVLQATVKEAQSAGLITRGAFLTEEESAVAQQLVDISGHKIAVLHYTDGLTSAQVKKLNSAGVSWAVSQSSQAVSQIAEARQLGAEMIVVSISWGKSGSKSATTAQKTLAQQLCDAGVDVIIGSGSRAVQPV